jgi:hypothetical protein
MVCLLLIALWVRSYYTQDCLRGYSPDGWPLGNVWELASREGKFAATICRGKGIKNWKLISHEISRAADAWLYAELGFEISERKQPVPPRGSAFTCPYWFAILLVATVSCAPWLRWRFSLRTLLIAMTLVAVVLGVMVYASR